MYTYSNKNVIDNNNKISFKVDFLMIKDVLIELKKYKNKIKILLFDHNNLTLKGATDILKFCNTLPNLKKIDLSYNNICDDYNKLIINFNKELYLLINKKKIKKIILINTFLRDGWLTKLKKNNYYNIKKIMFNKITISNNINLLKRSSSSLVTDYDICIS